MARHDVVGRYSLWCAFLFTTDCGNSWRHAASLLCSRGQRPNGILFYPNRDRRSATGGRINVVDRRSIGRVILDCGYAFGLASRATEFISKRVDVDRTLDGFGLFEQVYFAAAMDVLGSLLCGVAASAATSSTTRPVPGIIDQPALHTASHHLELAARLDHTATRRITRRSGQSGSAFVKTSLVVFGILGRGIRAAESVVLCGNAHRLDWIVASSPRRAPDILFQHGCTSVPPLYTAIAQISRSSQLDSSVGVTNAVRYGALLGGLFPRETSFL